MLGAVLIALALAAGYAVWALWVYLRYIRKARQWWLEHPEAQAARRDTMAHGHKPL